MPCKTLGKLSSFSHASRKRKYNGACRNLSNGRKGGLPKPLRNGRAFSSRAPQKDEGPKQRLKIK